MISSSPLSFIVSVSPSVAIWGSDVSISCIVTPKPYRATVRWTLNNSPFVTHNRITSDGDTAKSVVQEKATTRLTGNWTCVVGHDGKEEQVSATLTVKGKILSKN